MGELSGRRPDGKVEMIIKPLIRELREFSDDEIDDDAIYKPKDVTNLVRKIHDPLARIIEGIPAARQDRSADMPGVPLTLLGDAALPERKPHGNRKSRPMIYPVVHYVDVPCEQRLEKGAGLLAATIENKRGTLRVQTYNYTSGSLMKRSEVGWDKADVMNVSGRSQGASIYVRNIGENLARPAVDRDEFITVHNNDRQKRFVATLKHLTGILLDVAEGKEGTRG